MTHGAVIARCFVLHLCQIRVNAVLSSLTTTLCPQMKEPWVTGLSGSNR
jgi:hypothetical protein